MSPRLRARLRYRWVRDVAAVTFAGGLVLTLHWFGGLHLIAALLTTGAVVTPVGLIVGTFALRPKPEVPALKAHEEKEPDDT